MNLQCADRVYTQEVSTETSLDRWFTALTGYKEDRLRMEQGKTEVSAAAETENYDAAYVDLDSGRVVIVGCGGAVLAACLSTEMSEEQLRIRERVVVPDGLSGLPIFDQAAGSLEDYRLDRVSDQPSPKEHMRRFLKTKYSGRGLRK